MIMERVLLALLLPITLLVTSCGTGTHQQPNTAQSPAQHEHAEEATPDALPKVTLDSLGQRWIANPETTSGIATMVATLQAFDPAKGDASALKAALEEEFGLIFERCTMTGEAHNQLHNYLIPIHHALREFDGNNAHQREALAAHLATYATYFN
jgi:hypothetical protein